MAVNLFPRYLMELSELYRYCHGVADDFYHYVNADFWTVIASDAGGATIADGVGGIIALDASDGTVADNDETYLESKLETFKFVAAKPIRFEAFVQFSEANTDDANIIVGLKDAVAADSITDNGGGPASSYSGAVFFKVDGGTVWQVENSISTTQKTTELSAANSLTKAAVTAGGSAYQRLVIEAIPVTSTQMDVAFYVDGSLVAKHKDQAVASATEMQVVFGAKNGGANEETLNVDYCLAFQSR